MTGLTDQQLLRDYASSRSEPAFAEIARRHTDLVYSAALRMVRDVHLAEDVTQGVFLALAQNAATLAERPVIGGWLHFTTRNLTAKAVRSDVRRRAREQEAALMNELVTSQTDGGWEKIAPELDDALAELNESDRDAVVLRYFQRKSAVEMAGVLSISAEAAQKRVNRAVERLRELLAKRGIAVGAGGLAAVVSANAVQAAPTGLAVAVSSAAVLSKATFTAATTTKIIAMTTLQKILVTAAITVAVGAALYEARQVSGLRGQVDALQQQLTLANKRTSITEKKTELATTLVPITAKPAAQSAESDWPARLLALNTGSWQDAFSVGQQLAALDPKTGLAILRANWGSITNVAARQQLLKAFDFAEHERLPAVLELGLLDSSPEVQNWAANYLKEVALRDFTTDYSAGVNWLSDHRDQTLASAFTDALWHAAETLRNADPQTVRDELGLLKNAGALLAKNRDVVNTTDLPDTFARLINGNEPELEQLALKTVNRMGFSDRWQYDMVLPRLGAENSWEVREAAANALGATGHEWALQPLLDTLSDAVHANGQHSILAIAQPLAENGSPNAIPGMIALIEADNTENTIYGIGYYGLSKLTGVTYDIKHDGAWWRQWWETNKQRFPAKAQTLTIPRLEPLKKS